MMMVYDDSKLYYDDSICFSVFEKLMETLLKYCFCIKTIRL